MKSIAQRAEELAQSLDLPEDVLFGAEKVAVTAGKRLEIENHKGLLSYGDSYILVRLEKGKLAVSGSALELLSITAERIFIGGRIQTVEWE